MSTTFERAAELFERLEPLSPERRRAALAGLDEPDEVRAQLERMLAGAARPEHGLDAGITQSDGMPPSIGPFRIVRLLGEGGMGRVWEAEQTSPRRRVALKVIRAALVEPRILRRFEHEAEALARLQHPGLATVYATGHAEVRGERVPWLAMELVEGQPLDAWLEHAGPGLAGRVELVASLCDAVQHAHEKGVVHRDLKPSNVLVDVAGRPRIVDFGIARLTRSNVEVTTQETRPGAVLGTLPYMSPERLAGGPAGVDLRSDVYSLGVLLYRCLSGRLPLDLRGKSLAEAARVIAEEEPTALGELDTRLRGDLETIAAKALEKDVERRYQSAAELGEDLRRALRDEPIVARPATTLYQLGKFVRRNRRFVAALAFAALSLVAGLAASLVLAVREHGARALAEERAAELERQVYRQGIAEAWREMLAGRQTHVREIVETLPTAPAGWELDLLRAHLVPEGPRLAGSGYIRRVQSDAGGRRFAFVHADGPLLVVDAVDPAASLTLDTGGPARRFALAPDGQHAFTLGWDTANGRATARLWDGARAVRSEVHDAAEYGWADCAFDPTGALLAWGWRDGIVRAWEGDGGRERWSVRTHADEVRCLAFDASGRLLVVGGHGDDVALRVVDARDGSVLHAFPAEGPDVADLLFLGRTSRFACRRADGTLTLHDAATGEVLSRLELGESVRCLAADLEGERLWAGTDGGEVFSLDGRTARVNTVHGQNGIPVVSLAWSPRHEVLAVGQLDGRVRFVDPATGRTEGVVASTEVFDTLALVHVSPGGGPFVVVYGQGDVSFLSRVPRLSRVLTEHGSYVYGVQHARRGEWLASASWDRTLRVWDARALAPLRAIPLGDRADLLRIVGEDRALVSLMSGRIELFDLATGAAVWHAQHPAWDGAGGAVDASPDGARVVVAERQKTRLLVLDARDGSTLVEAGARALRPLAWSPRGTWIAAAAEGLVALHDPGTLEERRAFEVQGLPQRLAFSPDERWLAVGTREGLVQVLDTESGECAASLASTHGVVHALAFHPDGTRLAAGAQDGTITLMDTATWSPLVVHEAHTVTASEPTYRYVFELSFSPDGTQLVSASGDHTLRVWTTASDAP